MLLPANTHAEIEKLYRKNKHVELTVGILKDGEKEVIHWGPYRQIRGGEPLVYPVGSICKPFTASLLARYASEGKLDLDAPINTYIPGLPERWYPSLRMLATHHSGYTIQPYNLITTIPFFVRMNQEGGLFHTNPYAGYPDEEKMMEILRTVRLKDEPHKFVYSNIGLGILGYIVGTVSGKGFWDSMTEYIQDDLKLKNTFLGNVGLTGYDKKDQPCRCWQWDKKDIAAPAGALNATMEDLLDFAQMNLDGSRPCLAVCHEVQDTCDKQSDIGLTWRLDKELPLSWHTGAAGAFHCFLGFNRFTGTSIAVGINYGLANAEEIGLTYLRNEQSLGQNFRR